LATIAIRAALERGDRAARVSEVIMVILTAAQARTRARQASIAAGISGKPAWGVTSVRLGPAHGGLGYQGLLRRFRNRVAGGQES